jgi:hypothetical protein
VAAQVDPHDPLATEDGPWLARAIEIGREKGAARNERTAGRDLLIGARESRCEQSCTRDDNDVSQ